MINNLQIYRIYQIIKNTKHSISIPIRHLSDCPIPSWSMFVWQEKWEAEFCRFWHCNEVGFIFYGGRGLEWKNKEAVGEVDYYCSPRVCTHTPSSPPHPHTCTQHTPKSAPKWISWEFELERGNISLLKFHTGWHQSLQHALAFTKIEAMYMSLP